MARQEEEGGWARKEPAVGSQVSVGDGEGPLSLFYQKEEAISRISSFRGKSGNEQMKITVHCKHSLHLGLFLNP